MATPRKLKTNKTVRLIFTGGFLGSGKTTALAALARGLVRRGLRVGIITNDQSANLADTLIVRQMLGELGVPVEEVVKGCFCCKFDELIDQMEKILAHEPDILMGEPVGSCTDFVAAVANPIKIHYGKSFVFAPFSTMVDAQRVRELLLKETATTFPEEVAYLFNKQLEEADIVLLSKSDLLRPEQIERYLAVLKEKHPRKEVMAVSARTGAGMSRWLDRLLSSRPGAETMLAQLDYAVYARAEAVLGWLNAAARIRGDKPFAPAEVLRTVLAAIRDALQATNAGVGHLKMVMTGGGQSMWINLTHLDTEPVFSETCMADIAAATLIINARVHLAPDDLEAVVRTALTALEAAQGLQVEIEDLQCFSPAYPDPPYLMRSPASGHQ